MRFWQTICTPALSWHSHEDAYVALVLSGGYEEAGDCGRFRVDAGHVVFHDRFEAHLDRFPKKGVTLLNLLLPATSIYRPGLARVIDLNTVLRTAETDREQALEMLLFTTVEAKPQCTDWPDELASALRLNPSLRLSQWGEKRGLAPWTVSRGFLQVFGISPEAFRARARARQAWSLIQSAEEPLAKIAAHLGFADQAHMTRSVKQLTGMGPQAWRGVANRFKTQQPSSL